MPNRKFVYCWICLNQWDFQLYVQNTGSSWIIVGNQFFKVPVIQKLFLSFLKDNWFIGKKKKLRIENLSSLRTAGFLGRIGCPQFFFPPVFFPGRSMLPEKTRDCFRFYQHDVLHPKGKSNGKTASYQTRVAFGIAVGILISPEDQPLEDWKQSRVGASIERLVSGWSERERKHRRSRSSGCGRDNDYRANHSRQPSSLVFFPSSSSSPSPMPIFTLAWKTIPRWKASSLWRGIRVSYSSLCTRLYCFFEGMLGPT